MPVIPDPTDVGIRNPRAVRGSPQYRVSPVGNALQGFGQALGGLGAQLSLTQQENKKELDKQEAFGVQSRYLQFEDQWRKSFLDRTRDAPAGAANFKEGLQKDYMPSAKEFLGTVPVPLKAEFDQKLFGLETRLTDAGQEFQTKENDRYQAEQIDLGLNVLQDRVGQNPAEWKGAAAEGEQQYLNSSLPKNVQDAKILEWRKRLAEGIIATRDPATASGLLGIGTAPVSANVSGVYQGLQARGLSPMQAAVIAGNVKQESGGNPNSLNEKEGAHGIIQWRAERWTALKNFAAASGRDPNDINAQLDFILFEGSGAEKAAFDRFLAAGTPAEANRALKGYIRYGDSSEGTRLQNAIAVAGGKDMNQGQGPTVAAAAGSSPSVDPELAQFIQTNIPYADRVKAYDSVIAEGKRVAKEAQVEQRVVIEQASQDAPAAVARTGSYTGTVPTVADFVTAYGPVEGEQKAAQFRASMDVANQTHAMQTMPNDAITTTVAAATPVLTGAGADLEQKKYAALSQAAEATLKARAEDPGGYVQQVFPSVRQAWVGTQPGTPQYEAALSTTAEAEKTLGIRPENMELLPKSVAKASATQFNNVDMPEADRMAAVITPVFGTNDRGQQQAVFRQLVKAGVPSNTEGALEALSRNDDGAARRLLQAAMPLDPAKIGRVPASANKIRDQIQKDVMNEGEIGDVAYGLTLGDSSNYERAARDTDLMTRAVQIRLLAGEELSAAVAGVKKDLFGDREVVGNSGDIRASLLLPEGVDSTPIYPGLEAVTPKFRAALEATSGQLANNAPASTGEKAIVHAGSVNAIERVIDTGIYRNVGGGIGLFDPYTGLFVAGSDGKPMAVPIEEIIRLGMAVAPPPADSSTMSLPDTGLGGLDPTQPVPPPVPLSGY